MAGASLSFLSGRNAQARDKRYDVAYLTSTSDGVLAKPVRMPLTDLEYGSRITDPKHPAIVDVILGDKTTGTIQQKAAVDLDLEPGDHDEPSFLEVIVRGGWEGTVDTDEKPVTIYLSDSNHSGVFGDDLRQPGCGANWGNSEAPLDRMVIGDTTGGTEAAGTGQWLIDSMLFDGKLYSNKVDPTGRRITIGKYTGPAGTLSINVKNENGQPVDFAGYLYGWYHTYVGTESAQAISLPPDKYRVVADLSGRVDRGIEVNVRDVAVADGKETTITVGGPLTFTVVSTDDVITTRAGRNIAFKTEFMAGNNAAWYRDDPYVDVFILGPDGKKMQSRPGVIFHEGPWKRTGMAEIKNSKSPRAGSLGTTRLSRLPRSVPTGKR